MNYLKNHFRQAIRFALILSCLLNSMTWPARAERRPGSSRQPHSYPAIDRVRPDGMAAMSAVDRQTKARVRRARGRLPLRFEANAGQADSQVKFYTRGGGYNLFLTPTEAVLALRNEKSKGDANPQSVVRMKLAGANSAPQIEGIDALPGKSHYFIGNDPSKWRRHVTSYARVRYQGVYPGIDMVYYGAHQELEYDFIVAPGADPKAILLEFEGTQRIEVDAHGDLILYAAGGQVRQRKPVTYQEVGGRRREITSRYRLEGGNRVGFEIASYARSRPLVIDPILVYSTYLGGSGSDVIGSLAVDAGGNIYVAGRTDSLDFPTADPLQPICKGCPATQDLFVAKLNREGSALIYSTYLGGSGLFINGGPDLAVDRSGNAYLAGATTSDDFPTKDPLQPARAGSVDAFVTKLNADGSALVYSTYLGGSSADVGNFVSTKLAVDMEGNAYVAGATGSPDFPTKNPLQPTLKGVVDVFVTKLNASGSALIYSTYLGGGLGFGFEQAHDIAVDRAGNAYVTGWTASFDFPTANPLQPDLNRSQDAFVTKLNADGSALVYSTFLGGTGPDLGLAVAVDAPGNAYLTGLTYSTDFPTVSPGLSSSARRRSADSTYSTNFPIIYPLQFALSGVINPFVGEINPDRSAMFPAQEDPPLPPPSDAFVSKIKPDGSAIVYSTYLGGTNDDQGNSISVDSKGQAYVTGVTFSLDFPTVDVAQPIPDPIGGGDQINAFIVKLNPEGSDFIYSSYLGGGGFDTGMGIAVDAREDVYIVGVTSSDDLSVTSEAFQRRPRSSDASAITEGFITKISNRSRGHSHDHDHQDDDKDHQ